MQLLPSGSGVSAAPDGPLDDIMQGTPDVFPQKRPAEESVEELYRSRKRLVLHEQEAQAGAMSLAWVGVHRGQVLVDWAMEVRDKSQQNGDTWEEQVDDGELHFHPGAKG